LRPCESFAPSAFGCSAVQRLPSAASAKLAACLPLTRRQLIGLLLLTLMWGLNWPIMKICLRELAPLHFRAATMMGGP
jgi:hypothetical protein